MKRLTKAAVIILLCAGILWAGNSAYTALTNVGIFGSDGTQVDVGASGALSTSDFLIEVAKGNIPGHSQINKYGHNPAITTTSDPEDVWGGNGIYDFYFTTNQTVEAVSTDIDDVGSAIKSGTATGGSLTTLVDTGADFTAATAVSVGDVVINDTNGEFATVQAVTATTLTHTTMISGSTVQTVLPVNERSHANAAGDTYRIATSTDTGAGVIHVEGLTDTGSGAWEVATETVILNGQTDVAMLNTYVRLYRSFVLHAGSSGMNEGSITVEVDATTNAGVSINTMDGQTQQAIFTVPSGKTAYFITGYVGISSGGNPASPASSVFTWRARTNNGAAGVFSIKGQIEVIANGGQYWIYKYGVPVGIPEKSDIIIRCDEVSADIGVVGAFDMVLVDHGF